MLRHLVRGLCFSTLAAAAIVVSPTWAQQPGENASDAPAASQSASDQFAAKLEEWKTVLKGLRGLQREFASAENDQVPELFRNWQELIAKGESLMPELRKSGVAAYAEAPGQDRELERFLLTMLDDDVENDRYEPAAELAQGLIEAGCDVKRLYDIAGVAAFATNDFENAAKFLELASGAGVLSEAGSNFEGLLPEYTEYWEKEKEIRQKEAEADDLPRVKITTNRGEMEVELFENEAPDTVGNFISLVDDKFYDGLKFHRVLKGFMAQGGCPQGTGSGGPGYSIPCECYRDDYRKHFRGTLSMAHAGRDTGGSQFFITFVPTAHLNGQHTAFGRVVKGMEVLGELRRVEPGAEDGPEPDQIITMEVIRKRPDSEYAPKKVE